VLAFLVIVVLNLVVAVLAFLDARAELAQQFADGEYVTARYTARHLTGKYDLAGIALKVLSNEPVLGGGSPAETARLQRYQALLDGSPLGFYRYEAGARLTARWPAAAPEPPAEAVRRSFETALRTQRPAAAFFRTTDSRSRLLVMVVPPTADGGAARGTAVVMDTQPILVPPVLAEIERVEIHVLAAHDLEVLASTRQLPDGVRLDQLFRTETASLFDNLRQAQSGSDKSAVSLAALDGVGGEPYLLGAQGLDLGGEKLVLVATAPRRQLVDLYLLGILRWIAVIGVVGLLGLLSFVALVLQSRSEVKQERRRNQERSSLLKISHALLSEHQLEEVLRRIVDEARQLFRAGGATIALLDDETAEIVFRAVASQNPQVVKQLEGLRLPRDKGVLGWVVNHGEGVIVNDARTDPRFADEIDEQTGAQTMSLCCAPLMDQDDHTFGAIELVNNLENPFPDSDLVLLQSLAVTASAAVERAVFIERQAQQDRLRREMDIARTVQQGLLPRTFPRVDGFDLYGANTPAREVGGDFFDFIPVSDRHLGIVIADVADKGLGAAMFMVMCRSLLYAAASRELSPARVLEMLNQKILEVSSSDLFVTVFYGVLDLGSRTFRYTNGGHNPPLLHRHETGTIEKVTVPGMALGVIEPLEFDEDVIELRPGDRLVLYTDGITEAITAGDHAFGMPRLEAVLAATGGRGAEATTQAILASVEAFVAGQPQFDDMTLTVVQVELDDEVDHRLAARDRG